MAGDWTTGRLGDCVLLQSGGTPSKSRSDYWEGDVPWVSAKDMKSYWIENTEDHLSATGAEEATRIVAEGTTLMLVRGMTLHNDIPICRIKHPAAFNQDVKAVLAREGTEGDFVPYLLLGNKGRLLSIVDSAGHGTGRLNSDTLLDLPVHIPPVSDQRAISHVLGTLDDKIELNRKMNQTLETMAQAIFKMWFIDFDHVHAKAERRKIDLSSDLAALFPSSFEDSELGEIPKEWRVVSVDDLVSLSRDSVNPLDYPAERFYHFSIPAFDDGRVPKTELGTDIKSNKFIVTPDSVLLSKLNPRIPRIWLPKTDGQMRSVCSTEFLVASPKIGISREYLFSLFTSQTFDSIFATLVTGTSGSHQRVKAEGLLGMQVNIPPEKLITAYTKIVKPFFDQVNKNIYQSRTLAVMRDVLLPKLLSGEIRVNDALTEVMS